jgi:hypothetical protein
MTIKRFVLAASTMLFVAMSGQAYAGATISDARYWPTEASSAEQNAVQRGENVSDSTEMTQGIEAAERSYHGGPKEND